jgi:hypothetical protein
MSIIKTTFDIINNSWSKIEQNFDDTHLDLQFNAVGIDGVNVQNLHFGYSFTKDGNILTEGNFPTVGALDFIRETNYINDRINITRGSTYNLYVWAENFGDRVDQTFEIITPIPSQPFESWTFNGNVWTAPIPMPTDGPADAVYKWSEKQKKWFLMIPPLTDFDDI